MSETILQCVSMSNIRIFKAYNNSCPDLLKVNTWHIRLCGKTTDSYSVFVWTRQKRKCEWKIPRVCPLGNLGNNPHSESSTKVLSFAATVKANDKWNTHVFSFILKYCTVVTGNLCVEYKTIMNAVRCFPKTLPVSLPCVWHLNNRQNHVVFVILTQNLMNTHRQFFRFNHEFLIITASTLTRRVNATCGASWVALMQIFFIKLMCHVQTPPVLGSRALSQSTKLRSKTRSETHHLALFIATWPF